MNRRSFINRTALLGGFIYLDNPADWTAIAGANMNEDWFSLFKSPPDIYKPFVRWWWNGNKVNAAELKRELGLLKSLGIGGVEINPIEFPPTAEDMDIPSLQWLSPEWIKMVKSSCEDAHALGMYNDLIVGSGWPFGMETLEEHERAQVLIVYAKEVKGPTVFATSAFNILQEVDPGVTIKNPLRKGEIISLHLAKNPMNSLDDAIDLSAQLGREDISVEVPEGDFYFYAVVRYTSFASVINGAPGAAGSILDHMNKAAVEKYLYNMSDTMQKQIGPLSDYLRALFHDSMELEGSNWTGDFGEEFKKRCGYDVFPFLPFIMFKVGRLGQVLDEHYGAEKSEEFRDTLSRVRFDFEFVKASLLKERFTDTYVEWCRNLGVKSRGQAYGRGFFRLKSSMEFDIPEGESWTTNYLWHKLGEEMGDEDYRRGRGYTMINKYVSSAAHLSGKREISCEDMTNTYLVFNTELELMKVGSDQSILSGITHSVMEGYNYCPPDVPFPGWIRYGSYVNERSNFWPYFHLLYDYKARLSTQLMNADQYADIAILPADFDLWANHGVQTEPFPEIADPPYTTLLWEAIHKTGGGCDYVSEFILKGSKVVSGKLVYGKRSYGVLFLVEVRSISEEALQKIRDMVKGGGRVYCIDHAPYKSLGYKDYKKRDERIRHLTEEIQKLNKGFKVVPKPIDNRVLEWYHQLQETEGLPQYLKIESPDRYFMQNRYIRDDGSEFYFFQNANRNIPYQAKIIFDKKIIGSRKMSIWDPEKGERYRLTLNRDAVFYHDFGPAESLMIVVDKNDNATLAPFNPLPNNGYHSVEISKNWKVNLHHSQTGQVSDIELDNLIDMKLDSRMETFTGTATYRKDITIENPQRTILNLGKVFGISEVIVNGQHAGVRWYGRRLFDITGLLQKGTNRIEVKIVTTMGNYVKTLKHNKA
ncbi:MAG: glycoside hydrolase family 2 [Chitinophagaceae bacterium]|nr:glycoside hydrolase family 2 [Chitinophagaceae bacterium]